MALFEDYLKIYKKLADEKYLDQKKALDRPLRLFDIRLRLALGIKVDFDSKIASTKTKPVKECYACLIKLVELWNAFEALVVFDFIRNGKKGKCKWFELVEKAGPVANKYLEKGFDQLKTMYKTTTFQNDFEAYIEKVKDDVIVTEKEDKSLLIDTKTGRNLSKKKMIAAKIDPLNDVLLCIKTDKKIELSYLVTLIDIERNLFYHIGEAARMGMNSYANRRKLLELYIKTFSDYMLAFSIELLRKG